MKFSLALLALLACVILCFYGVAAVGTAAEVQVSHFEAYLDKFYPGMREGAHAETLAAISAGLKNGHITLASLINVAENIALEADDSADADEELEAEELGEAEESSLVAAEEQAAEEESEEGGAGTEGTEADGSEVEQRGENGCLMYQGLECGGPRRGVCKAEEKTCTCLGGWTGIRCQNEWSVRRYSPYTGLSEANEECAASATGYLRACT